MSEEKRNQARREEIRHEVLAHLYNRSSVAQSAATILRHLRREMELELSEVESACEYLAASDIDYLELIRDPLGATRHYRITGKGSQFYESSRV